MFGENPASGHSILLSVLTDILDRLKSADCSFLYSFLQILLLGLAWITSASISSAQYRRRDTRLGVQNPGIEAALPLARRSVAGWFRMFHGVGFSLSIFS